MKKTLLFALLFVSFCFNTSAQCDMKYVEQCKKSIDKTCVTLGTYNLNFDGIEKVKNYDVGLRKDTRYRFNLYYDATSTPPVVEILLGDDILLSTNMNGKNYKTIDFVCKNTHSYNLRVKGKNGCLVVFVSSVIE